MRSGEAANPVTPAVLGVIQLPVGPRHQLLQRALPAFSYPETGGDLKGDIAGRMEGQLADFLLNPRGIAGDFV